MYTQIYCDFVHSIDVNANLEYWIGLSWDVNANDFTWSDSEELDFTDWMPDSDEPNNSGDCVRIAKLDKWRDHPCTMVYNYVCKTTGDYVNLLIKQRVIIHLIYLTKPKSSIYILYK